MAPLFGSQYELPYHGLPSEIRRDIWLYSLLMHQQQKQQKPERVERGFQHPLANAIGWAFTRLQHNSVGNLLTRLFATAVGFKGLLGPQTSTIISLLLANQTTKEEAAQVFKKQTSYRLPPGPPFCFQTYLKQIPTYQQDLISTVTIRFCAADYQGPHEWDQHYLDTSRRLMASEGISARAYRENWLEKLIWVVISPSTTNITIEGEGMEETFCFESKDHLEKVWGDVEHWWWSPHPEDPYEGWPFVLWDFAKMASENVAEKLYTQAVVDGGSAKPALPG